MKAAPLKLAIRRSTAGGEATTRRQACGPVSRNTADGQASFALLDLQSVRCPCSLISAGSSQVPTVLGLVVGNCQWGTNNRHVGAPNSRAASGSPSPRSAPEHGLPSRLTGRPSAVRNDCASLTLPTDRCVRLGLMDSVLGRSSDVDFILR